MRDFAAAQTELRRREQKRPSTITSAQFQALHRLGTDIRQVWTASTTTDRDRKELVRTLVEEVIIAIDKNQHQAHLTLRWRGGLLSELDAALWHVRTPAIRTDEDTIDLVRRLALHYPDAVIAGILNRQGRRTATMRRLPGDVRIHRQCPEQSDEHHNNRRQGREQASSLERQ